ncbi:ABC transporter ATP-binding protein [Aquimarina sp. U1-2]|uniref:ABC transporter ATP-binding protein n=1 Tax=Aquimarina sp. U1-2 TaxID=2823141 RepID=UPI001AECCEA1|nr:ABC transporter ATP-binding protein [Aquimarina sp. U1-2]MBP2831024.1 ABC transporter ATP-binding protein [Aquimarina sp. U1-2]
MSAIYTERITKMYNKVHALNGLSIHVDHGEIFGLIGPDGAGKSTFFRILTTLLLADSGMATVAGHDVVKEYKEIRKKVGYMPGKFSLYQDLSVEENLTFFATIFGTTIKQNYDLVKEIYEQIEPFKERPAGKLSGGMKQKLALCCALIHKPEVLFLDEPTTGVDTVSRREFWDMLASLKEKGIGILVSTPYMDEAGRCDRIGLLQEGKLLKADTPKGIIDGFKKSLYAIKTESTYKTLLFLRKQEFTESALPFGEYIHLSTKWKLNENQILSKLKEGNLIIKEVKRIIATVEDVFLDLSSKKSTI